MVVVGVEVSLPQAGLAREGHPTVAEPQEVDLEDVPETSRLQGRQDVE